MTVIPMHAELPAGRQNVTGTGNHHPCAHGATPGLLNRHVLEPVIPMRAELPREEPDPAVIPVRVE